MITYENSIRELNIPIYNGTGVLLDFDVRNIINLEDTFIGTPSYTYIDHLVDKAESNEGILIKDECLHTRGRETARPLREKVELILSRADEPITLNFNQILSCSSSFLDELLGKFVEKVGISSFIKNIKISNAKDQIINMTNVVIQQRMNTNDKSE